MPLEVHVLPVAADARRASLPRAQRRKMWRRKWRWRRNIFRRCASSFFDDDTFTDDLPRAEEIARRLGKLGLTWSCNAKANVPRKTLEIMKDNGLRLLLVGYESGNDQILINIKKGVRLDIAREFSRNCTGPGHQDSRHIHSRASGRDHGDDSADHQVCMRHRSGNDSGFARRAVSGHGTLPPGAGAGLAANPDRRTCGHARNPDGGHELSEASSTVIFSSVEELYRKFYFRPRKMFSLFGGMLRDPEVMKRRLARAWNSSSSCMNAKRRRAKWRSPRRRPRCERRGLI